MYIDLKPNKLIPEVEVWVQNCPGVLSMIFPCPKCMKLACRVLHGNFGPVYLLEVSRNYDEKRCFLKWFGFAKKHFKMRKCYLHLTYHSINPTFDLEVAEKSLNGIYCIHITSASSNTKNQLAATDAKNFTFFLSPTSRGPRICTSYFLSICTGILGNFDILQFEISSLMNWFFFLVWKQTGYFYQFKLYFFPSFWARVKYFDGPCITIYSLFTIYRDIHYQFLVWWIHYSQCYE